MYVFQQPLAAECSSYIFPCTKHIKDLTETAHLLSIKAECHIKIFQKGSDNN